MQIYDLSTKLSLNRDLLQAPNLADRFTAEDLTCIGQHVWEGYSRDQASRYPWLRRTEAAMDLAMQVQKDKNFPWPGCSNVIFPLITIAALQFSSRSYSNIIQGTNVVKQRVAGENPSADLLARARRIGSHMSWQVLEEDESWEEEHDRLLINLGIVGSNFVKTFFSPSLGHNTSQLVMARDLVINYWAKSVNSAVRKTHIIPLYRNDIYERVRKEIFSDVLDDPWFKQPPTNIPPNNTYERDQRAGSVPPQPDEDSPFQTLEQHKLLDLDKDGYAEPYIITIEATSKKVLRIVSRIEREEDIERISGRIATIVPEEYFTKYGFIPAPDGGIYDVGFGVLLGPLNEGVNTGVNQIFDAGTMMNSNGGFLGRGAKIRGGQYSFAPWEWKRVDSTGDDLRKSLVPLMKSEPSSVMFQMIGLLINYTDRLAGTVDTMVGENPGQNTKTGVANQTLEQGMAVYSSIFKRVWRSMKQEFGKLAQLNRQFLPASKPFGDKGGVIRREDYNTDIEQIRPVADPRLVSDAMRVQQAQVLSERASQVPGYNLVAVERNLLEAMHIEGIETFYPGPDKIPPPVDPKVQMKQAELQFKQMELEQQKFLAMTELAEQRRLNNAQIAQLEAQALKLMHDAQIEDAEHRLAVFNAAINAYKTHNEALTNRIQAIQGQTDESGNSNGGGVPQLAGPPSDENLSPDAGEVA